MSNDLSKRAQHALQKTDLHGLRGSAAAPRDQAEAAALLARAARIAGSLTRQISTPVRAPGGERVKLPVMCSARGASYIVVAERRGDELHFVGHELPQSGTTGAARMPSELSGQYRIAADGWACPLCSDTHGIWTCNCERMNGAIHCLGSAGGRHHCACGRFEEHEFVGVETSAVRGTSVAATPSTRSAPSAFRTQRLLK